MSQFNLVSYGPPDTVSPASETSPLIAIDVVNDDLYVNSGNGWVEVGAASSGVSSVNSVTGAVVVEAGSSGTIGVTTSGQDVKLDSTTATTSQLGVVKPDGATIDVTAGVISVPTATTGALGLVKPDGSTIDITSGVISVPTATDSVLGLVKPDGTTITISSGVISSVGSSSSGFPFTLFQEKQQVFANGTSFTMNFAKDLQSSGATVYLLVATDGTTTFNVPSGWTEDFSAGASVNASLFLIHKTSDGTGSVTITTNSTASATLIMFELGGSRSLDQSSTGDNSSTLTNNAQVMPSITPTSGAAVFAFMAYGYSATIYSDGVPDALEQSINGLWKNTGMTNLAVSGGRSLSGMVYQNSSSGAAIAPPIFNFIAAVPSGASSYATFSIK